MSDLKFTDNDLKRLKEEFEPCNDCDARILTADDWLGLIARMEADENYIEALESNTNPENLKFLKNECRKAAGKI